MIEVVVWRILSREKGRKLHMFELLLIVLIGVIYAPSESYAQVMYPVFLMQTHSSSQVADNLYSEGMDLYNARKFDSSATYLRRAFKIYDSMGDNSNRLLSLAQLTTVYAILQNIEVAKRYTQLFLEDLQDTSRVSHRMIVYFTYALANVYEIIGEYKKGMRFIQKAEQLYDDSNPSVADKWILARIYYVNGALEDDFSNYDRAIDYTKRCLNVAKQLGGGLSIVTVDSYNLLGIYAFNEGKYDIATNYLKEEIDILQGHPEWKNVSDRFLSGYINSGNVFFATGDYHTALSYYQKALRMVNNGASETSSDEELILNNIAATYYQMGNLKNALQFFLKTLPLKIKKLGPDHPDVAVAYVNIGLTYQALKEDKKAIDFLNKGLAIRKKVFGRNNVRTMLVYSYLALVYKDQKKYNMALQYLEKDLSVSQAVLGLHHPETANSLEGIADVYRAMGSYDRALEYYQKALQALAPNFHSPDIAKNPNLDHILSENTFKTILERKAATLVEAARKNRQLANRYIPIAVGTYDTAIRFIKKLRDSYQEESSKFLLNKDTYSVYAGAIAACMLGFHQSGDEAYLEKAFYFSQKSKASVLLQSIEDAKAQKYSGIPDSLLKREGELRQIIMRYSREIDQETGNEKYIDSIKIGKLQDKLFAARQHFDTFVTSLEKTYPAYYELKYKLPRLTIPEIQKKLGSDQAYLGYFVGDSTIYTFEITKNNYNVISSPIDSASFTTQLRNFRKAIISSNWSAFTNLGYRLYQKLIGPVRSDIRNKNLVIIPDPMLSLVPFEALLTDSVSEDYSGDYANLPYLMRRHAVTYGYSSYLIFGKQSGKAYHSSGLLGIAPVFDESIDTLSIFRKLANGGRVQPLLSSLNEVRGIYSVISANPSMKDHSHIYLRKQATESRLNCQGISNYKYIHLATHAYVNEKRPGLSGILFYPGSDGSSNDDGILYTGEIYNLNLHARLVVLSACETAVGQLIRGEGIIGFTRAFLYAGAKNVVVSLWNVLDRSSPDFMITFYRYLMMNDNVALSLQHTKIDMINEKRYANPVYWASMVQIR